MEQKTTYTTFAGWKRAVKAKYPTAKFWGDPDCRCAEVTTEYTTVTVAEWGVYPERKGWVK